MGRCIICGKEEPVYPVVDFTTGFYFCDGCWMKTGEAFDKYKEETLSNWLRAIADTRDKYGKKEVVKKEKAKVRKPSTWGEHKRGLEEHIK